MTSHSSALRCFGALIFLRQRAVGKFPAGLCLQFLSLLALLISFSFNIPLSAATLPSGFTETQLAVGLSNPTAMAFAPDGRLFVCQQGGQVRVIKNGSLLAAPFLSVTVNSQGERGLLGIAFDPDFNNNHFIYVYYTATTPAVHNRVSRFTADGDLAAPGSEAIIFELNNLNSAIHNGGAMHFGPDGKLYIAVGENSVPSNAQTLENLLGKLLRINSNGTIPTDNPFFNTAAGNNRAIWALGLRNPYTFAFQPGTGRLFINDVGQDGWEEINEGIAGANYGWPTCEGACSNPDFKNPVFAYSHLTGETLGCAITGGAFYNPVTAQFPDSYAGSYFFADFCSGWIKRIDPANPGHSTDFASDILYPVGLLIGPEGGLYYLERGHGAVYRILYAPVAPLITTQPQSQIAGEGQTVTFSVTASGSQPLAYQWQRDGVNIQGATSSSYTISSVTSADQGAQFRVIISNIIGSVTSNTATLTVSQNKPPAPVILTPAEGTLYSAGDIINFSGTATDTEDGSLPA
ncbi:MAG TPA: PQQ-dependent sugar dehydrogenase, partial [Pyrinomonadaceae bacterium]